MSVRRFGRRRPYLTTTGSGASVSTCKHQLAEIEHHLATGIRDGKALRLTQAEAEAGRIETFCPADATREQQAQWAEQNIRFVLYAMGTRCRKCGHVATGTLTQCSAEDMERWEKEAAAPLPWEKKAVRS